MPSIPVHKRGACICQQSRRRPALALYPTTGCSAHCQRPAWHTRASFKCSASLPPAPAYSTNVHESTDKKSSQPHRRPGDAHKPTSTPEATRREATRRDTQTHTHTRGDQGPCTHQEAHWQHGQPAQRPRTRLAAGAAGGPLPRASARHSLKSRDTCTKGHAHAWRQAQPAALCRVCPRLTA
jgi:hypothetical protein